jgi:XRE family transcriptional regulator, regulator of sulfur utilization
LKIDKLLVLQYYSEINTLGMTVKILLKKVRKDKNLSINDMARLTGLSPQYLGKLEKNKGNPSLSVLNTLCKCLSVNPGDLLEYSDD